MVLSERHHLDNGMRVPHEPGDRVGDERTSDTLTTRLFSHDKTRTAEGRRFWAELVGTKEAMMQGHDLEGYDEVLTRYADWLVSQGERNDPWRVIDTHRAMREDAVDHELIP